MKCRIIQVLLFTFLIVSFTFYPTTITYAEGEKVYLGGIPIGIGLAEKGLIVTGMVDVITDEGSFCPARGSEILTDDVIVKVNGTEVSGVSEFASELQKSGNHVDLTLKRGDREYNVSLSPVTDALTGLKKVGLVLKNGINGIGTLTFITKEDKFGALGHGIVDVDTGKPFITDEGSIYSCLINGYRRPEAGKAGELSGKFMNRDEPIGKITKCNEFGVYGTVLPMVKDDLKEITLGNKSDIRTGPALIYSTISGNVPKAYKIDIIKLSNQQKPTEKSMLIRVTDKELLAETGGILQGMSGSPIVQNGKLIGAVTHVLVNDSTLGYGLYIDWMIENAA